MTQYPLLPEEKCFAKTHHAQGKTYLETYRSHVDCAKAYSDLVWSRFSLGTAQYLGEMVQAHDLGKRAEPFQAALKTGKRQPIRHETLSFLKWLEGCEEVEDLDGPRALAILAHHVTLLDKEQAAIIERHMISQPSFADMLAKWNQLRGTPWIGRMDSLLLRTLPLVDYLRTVDALASYTSDAIFQRHMGGMPSDSLFAGRWPGDLAKELSCFNLSSSDMESRAITQGDTVSFDLVRPVKAKIEGVRWQSR